MSASWQRWLRYAKAKLDSTVKEGEADLDEREARLKAEAEGKPWLSSTGDSPTFDEMRARIEHDARQAGERRRRDAATGGPVPSRPGPRLEGGPSDGTPPTGGPASAAGVSTGLGEDPLASFDMAAHEKAADERLATIRRELGLADDEADSPTGPGTPSDAPDAPVSPPSGDPPEDPDDDTPIAPV